MTDRPGVLWLVAGYRRDELKATTRSDRVVVPSPRGRRRLEMTPGNDEEIIKAVVADGPQRHHGSVDRDELLTLISIGAANSSAMVQDRVSACDYRAGQRLLQPRYPDGAGNSLAVRGVPSARSR